jgi:hypothetical protein
MERKIKCQGQTVKLPSSNLESLETEKKGQGQAVKLSMYPGNMDNMKERSGQDASIRVPET